MGWYRCGNILREFYLVRVTGKDAKGLEHTVCKVNVPHIHNQYQRLENCAWHFEVALRCSFWWSASTDSPAEEKERLSSSNDIKSRASLEVLFEDSNMSIGRESRILSYQCFYI